MKKVKIAFTGGTGSGKTEAANYLKEKYEFDVLSFSDGIKYVDRYLFGLHMMNPVRLQQICNFFCSLDSEIWVKRTLENLEFVDHVAIDDLFHLNEYEALVSFGFLFARLVADTEVRAQRLHRRGGSFNASMLSDESEKGCAGLKMVEINNNGSFDDLYAQLDFMMEKLGLRKTEQWGVTL